MPQVALVIGAVATVAGAIQSNRNARESLGLQQEQQELQTRRSRRASIREFQIRRAAAVAGAVGSGSFDSSGGAGGIGSLGSQLGSNLGFSTAMSGLSGEINNAERGRIQGQFLSNLGGFTFNQALRYQDREGT